MKTSKNTFLLTTFIISLLIYEQNLGLNMFLTPLITSILLYTKQKEYISKSWLFSSLLWILSGLGVSLWNLDIGMPLFLICTFNFFAVNYNQKLNLPITIVQSIISLFTGIIRFFKFKTKGIISTEIKSKKMVYRVLLIGVPIIITLIFLKLYQTANPEFEELTDFINLDFIEWSFFLVYFIVLLTTYGLFNFKPNQTLLSFELLSQKEISQNTVVADFEKENFEWQLALTIVSLLSLLLLFFIGVEIHSLRSPNSEITHSQNVHQGINILIGSIILVILIIIVLFKGQLNFTKSKILRHLTIFWLSLNSILIVIITFKNYSYIADWGLTHKRIGVFVYLILCLIGLFLTGKKVQTKVTTFTLIKHVSNAFISVLIIFGLLNWNGIIAKYNFNENNLPSAKIDFKYLAKIGPETYPYLLKYIEKNEAEKWVKVNYLDRRINQLKALYESNWTTIFSYKLGSYLAYKQVMSSPIYKSNTPQN